MNVQVTCKWVHVRATLFGPTPRFNSFTTKTNELAEENPD